MRVDKASRYTRTHEWVRLEGDEAVSGITDYAQEHLSDIVFVELPAEGDHFDKGEVYGVVESVKAASDVFAPLAGTIATINEQLADAPEIINEAAESDGWLCTISGVDASTLEELMTPQQYEEYCKSLQE